MKKNNATVSKLVKRKLKTRQGETSQFQNQLLNMFSLKKTESSKSKIMSKFSTQIESAEKINVSEENLVNGLQRLHDTWMHAEVQDSEPARVICPVLYNKLSDPLILALISDGLTYFKNNEEGIHPYKALQIACLAGSSGIGNYLLEKYPNYITQDFILPFSISSGNDSWVEHLAITQINKGLEFPKNIYLYGSSVLAQKIERMFSTTVKAEALPEAEALPKAEALSEDTQHIFRFNNQLLKLIYEHLATESEQNKKLFFQEIEKTLPELKITILSKGEEAVSKKLIF